MGPRALLALLSSSSGVGPFWPLGRLLIILARLALEDHIFIYQVYVDPLVKINLPGH